MFYRFSLEVHVPYIAVLPVDNVLYEIDILLGDAPVLIGVGVRIFVFIPSVRVGDDAVDGVDIAGIDEVIVVRVAEHREIAGDLHRICTFAVVVVNCETGARSCSDDDGRDDDR